MAALHLDRSPVRRSEQISLTNIIILNPDQRKMASRNNSHSPEVNELQRVVAPQTCTADSDLPAVHVDFQAFVTDL